MQEFSLSSQMLAPGRMLLIMNEMSGLAQEFIQPSSAIKTIWNNHEKATAHTQYQIRLIHMLLGHLPPTGL